MNVERSHSKLRDNDESEFNLTLDYDVFGHTFKISLSTSCNDYIFGFSPTHTKSDRDTIDLKHVYEMS